MPASIATSAAADLSSLREARGVPPPPAAVSTSEWPSAAQQRLAALRSPPKPRPRPTRLRVTRHACQQLTEQEREDFGYQEHLRVVVRDCGNGHAEATVHPHVTLCEVPPQWLDESPIPGAPDPDACRRASARRARRAVRLRCKSLGLDTLLTLTYRENVQDRARVLRDWKEFVRRLRRVLPSFAYVCVLEKQKRGAIHLHFACKRLPREFQREGVRVKSYPLILSIWRSVTGSAGGSFRCSRGKRGRSPLQIAKYISKYIGKALEDHEFNSRQYFAGGEWSAPLVTSRLFGPDQWIEAVTFCDSCVGFDERDWFQLHERGVYWIAGYSVPS